MNHTQKKLLALSALLTLLTIAVMGFVPALFEKIFFDMKVRLPIPTQFILAWHGLLMWLPLITPLLVFAEGRSMKTPGTTLFIATLIVCTLLLIATLFPICLPFFH